MPTNSLLPDFVVTINNISLSNDITKIFTFIQYELITHHEEVVNMISLIDLHNILNIVFLLTDHQKQTCISILNQLIKMFPSFVLVELHTESIIDYLRCDEENLQTFMLQQVRKMINECNIAAQLFENCHVIEALVALIGSRHEYIATMALECLQTLSANNNCIFVQRNTHVMEIFRKLLAPNSTDAIRYRAYDLAVTSLTADERAFATVREFGVVSELVHQACDNDILLQLNALDMLAKIAHTEYGFEHLQSLGLMNNLLAVFSRNFLRDNQYPLELPGVCRFFSELCQTQSTYVIDHCYPFLNFVKTMLGCLHHKQMLLLALDSIVYLFVRFRSRREIMKHEEFFQISMCRLGQLLKAPDSEIKARVLNVLMHLVSASKTDCAYIEEHFDEFSDTCYRIFALLSSDEQRLLNSLASRPAQQSAEYCEGGWQHEAVRDTFNTIWMLARRPFLDIKSVALLVIYNVAKQVWGARLLSMQTPGFIEFLLDSSSETSHSCRQLKYDIVVLTLSMAEHHCDQIHLSEMVAASLKQFKQNGCVFTVTRLETSPPRAHLDV